MNTGIRSRIIILYPNGIGEALSLLGGQVEYQ